jgi:23S rRNA (uracil1939-C5)-methyltransferase
MTTPKRGSIEELEIERLAFGGLGVSRTGKGMVVFIRDGLPGQRVRARLVRIKKRHAEAVIDEILRESPHAVAPRCRHFGPCGGCRLQHLDYAAQLSEKSDQVRDALERLGRFNDPPVEETIPGPRTFGYRNKMEYSFGDMRWLTAEEMDRKEEIPERFFGLGLHPRGRWDRVIHLHECHLPDSLSVEIMRAVQDVAIRSALRPFTTRTQEGFWRFLVVRQGVRTDQWMVDLITSENADGTAEVDALAARLMESFPRITTITHTTTTTQASVATGNRMRILAGPGFIEEEISGLRFRISPRAFFQTNTDGAERLYQEARELAGLKQGERVYDVYCGTGTIALLMAARAGEVIGFELESSAVVDARANAELNALKNATFVEGDAAELLKEGPRWGDPDVVILDPPRAGLPPELRRIVPGLGADRLVYVSCNPATLARDLQEICANGYELRVVKPLDMFPHTPHVECVSLLTASGE